MPLVYGSEGIIKKAEDVKDLVPEAKVGFAHGKMTGKELEEIMLDFIEKRIDVLVCTTINIYIYLYIYFFFCFDSLHFFYNFV